MLIDDDDLVVPSSNAYPGRFDLKTGKLKDFKLPLGGRVPGGWYASLAGKSEEKKGKRKRHTRTEHKTKRNSKQNARGGG